MNTEGIVLRKSTGFLGLMKRNFAKIITEDKALTREMLKSYYVHFYTKNNEALARMMTMATLFSKNTLVFYNDESMTNVVRMYHLNDMLSVSAKSLSVELVFPSEVVTLAMKDKEETDAWLATFTAIEKYEINEESESFVDTMAFYLKGGVYEETSRLKDAASSIPAVITDVLTLIAPPTTPVEACMVGTEVRTTSLASNILAPFKSKVASSNAEIQTEEVKEKSTMEATRDYIYAAFNVNAEKEVPVPENVEQPNESGFRFRKAELAVKKKGYLLKRGSRIRSNWNVRYFILTTDNKFHFFKAKQYDEPTMTFSTEKCQFVIIDKKACTFKVTFGDFTFYLKGANEDDMESWLSAFSD
jgi:hypothetical protein